MGDSMFTRRQKIAIRQWFSHLRPAGQFLGCSDGVRAEPFSLDASGLCSDGSSWWPFVVLPLGVSSVWIDSR